MRELAKTLGKEAMFGENGPSDRWFVGFLKRHPTMTEKKSTRREHTRMAQSNEAVNDHWFKLLGMIEEYYCDDIQTAIPA